MPTEEAAEDGSGEAVPDNVLYDLYETYIGEPEEETDVYLGFGLFFGGPQGDLSKARAKHHC